MNYELSIYFLITLSCCFIIVNAMCICGDLLVKSLLAYPLAPLYTGKGLIEVLMGFEL